MYLYRYDRLISSLVFLTPRCLGIPKSLGNHLQLGISDNWMVSVPAKSVQDLRSSMYSFVYYSSS